MAMDKHKSVSTPRLPRHASLLLLLGAALPPLAAADIRVEDPAGQTHVIESALGVPVINIANPNSQGLSHNRFEQFDVGKPGAIFNNSVIAGESHLGGLVGANPNLTGNARAILTEVTGNQPSSIAGALEVFGGQADVIVANPNGITLNGVTTRNVNGFVASTGRPQLANGLYLNIENGSGRVVVGANGVDTAGLSYFDVVARTVALNGKVGASGATADVQVLAGQNRYNGQLRTATPLGSAADTAPSGVAIEGSLAGAMYGRHISLISTESGVGVRHAGLIHAAQNIVIQANGDIDLLPASSVQQDGLTGNKGVAIGGGIQAGGELQMTTAGAINVGTSTQGSRITVQAKALNLNSATLKATGYDPLMRGISLQVEELNLTGNWLAHDSLTDELLGRDQPLVMEKGKLQVARKNGHFDERFTLTSDARIESNGGIDISTHRLNNDQGFIDDHSTSGLHISAGSVNNLGILRSDGDVALTTGMLDNRCTSNAAAQTLCGGIFSDATATLQIAALNNRAGLVAKDDLKLALGENQHSNGVTASIAAGKDLQVTGPAGSHLFNHGEVIANQNGQITLDNFDNGLTGWVGIFGDLRMDLLGAFTNAGSLTTKGSATLAMQDMQLSSGANLAAGGGITVTAKGDIRAERATNLYSQGEMNLTAAGSMASAATIFSDGDVVLRADGILTNTGNIVGASNIDISSEQMVKNDGGGLVYAGQNLTLSSKDNLFNLNNSMLLSNLGLTFHVTNTLLNDQSIVEGGDVMINADTLFNRHASLIHGLDTLNIKVGTFQDNTEGSILQVNDTIIVQADLDEMRP